jgi:hypothetical protein
MQENYHAGILFEVTFWYLKKFRQKANMADHGRENNDGGFVTGCLFRKRQFYSCLTWRQRA